MSTPTPAYPGQPSSASKKPPGHASTPRSVPSPAATRKEQAGKTPTNHPTVSSQGSKTLGSTPMVQNLSQTGMANSSSPGHNISFGTPGALAGLGVDLATGTPGQMNMATPLVGSSSMMPTMSELGLTASGAKRNEDEERRAKMRKVLKRIGRPKGRVGEEGIARISRRVGFQNDIDADILSAEEKERLVGNRTITIAGHKTVIEVDLKDNIAQRVSVECSGKKSAPAGDILLNDLKVSDATLQESRLDPFAANMARLAETDRLSSERTGVDCFEAIDGLHKSLARLYELEKAAAAQAEDGQNSAEHEVLCKKSGRPAMHARSRIGLAIEYWRTNNEQASTEDTSAMDVDHTNGSIAASEYDLHSLRIEAEGSSSAMYPSLRVSDAWLPESFELPAAGSGEGIPWQDPPPTYAKPASSDQGDEMAVDGARLPDIRFIAKLDPPIVMPYQTAINIFNAVNAQVPQMYMMQQYHGLLFNIPAQSVQPGMNIEAEQTVLCLRNDEERDVTHGYTLDIPKPEWGYKLEEIPFSHPRQLVALLPTLRQWAHVGVLLRNAFDNEPTASKSTTASNGVDGKNQNGQNNGIEAEEMTLDDLLKSPVPEEAMPDGKLLVNVAITTSPQPTLSLTFAGHAATTIGNVVAQILPNADISILDFEGIGEEGSNGMSELDQAMDVSQTAKAKKFAKALAVSGDLGIFIEWLRSQS